jgi:D-alanyl-D-alanine carboxypeptidase
MTTSWQPGCPVPFRGLRLLTVKHRRFDGADHVGELVVAAAVAPDVVQVFHELYDHRYPIESLRLVDDFGGSGESMAANNSSAFNCQPTIGGTGFSEHSSGTAIDLNLIQNPYVSGNVVLPEQGRAFLARSPAPGVIRTGDAVVTAFTRIGWSWGGSWCGPIDYQHFSATGR